MRFLPPRRWIQFRLSTWFVLVAIVAWAMTCRPWWTEHYEGYAQIPSTIVLGGWDWKKYVFDNRADYEANRQKFIQTGGGWYGGGGVEVNRRLAYPAIGFLAFLAIKGVMALPALKSPQDSQS
jgi:hypothetical protein